jgi:putative salt-induced outer membrane protein
MNGFFNFSSQIFHFRARWAHRLAVSLAFSTGLSFALLTPVKVCAETEKPGFSGSSDLGSTFSSGNTQTENVSAKTDNKYRYDSNEVSMAARYLRTRDRGTESARYWDAEIRYARDISDWWAAYVGYKAESDPFAGYVQRDSADVGLKYVLTNEEGFHWFAEVGYRHSKTHNVLADQYDNFARLYTEANKDITKTTSAKISVEHLPNLKDDAAYLTNTEVSLTVVMSEILSLKTAYLTKFQNAPPAGFEKTDTTFITALVAKY